MAGLINHTKENNDKTKIVLTITDELRHGKIVTKTDIRRDGSLLSVNFEYERSSGLGTNPEDIKRVLDLCNVNYRTEETRYKI